MRLFVRRGLWLTLLGIGAGVAAAVGLTRVIARFLYGASPADPATFAAVAILLAVGASYIPVLSVAGGDRMKVLCEKKR